MKGMKIISCTCKHDYQDRTYGQGKRVANIMKNNGLRCTVCNRETSAPVSEKEKDTPKGKGESGKKGAKAETTVSATVTTPVTATTEKKPVATGKKKAKK